MTDTGTDPRRPRGGLRPGLRWLLFGSLALNLAVAGLVIGSIVDGHDGRPPRGVDLAYGPFARALDRDDRVAIRRHIMRHEAMRPPSAAELRESLDALLRAVRAEPFDPAAATAALEAMGAQTRGLQVAAQAALVARLGEMDAADRAAFAERLAAELRRGPEAD